MRITLIGPRSKLSLKDKVLKPKLGISVNAHHILYSPLGLLHNHIPKANSEQLFFSSKSLTKISTRRN